MKELIVLRVADLDERVAGLGGNTALVVLVPGHLDVTVDTPVGAPGVLDEPVVGATVRSVANDEDTVVERCAAAVRLIVDTWGTVIKK